MVAGAGEPDRPLIARLQATVTGCARLRVGDLAAELRVHPTYFFRSVRSETGLTFRQWDRGLLMNPAVSTARRS